MAEEFEGDGAGPSRAQAVGLGRITGPGESIADSSKWMRSVWTFRQFGGRLLIFVMDSRAQGTWNLCRE